MGVVKQIPPRQENVIYTVKGIMFLNGATGNYEFQTEKHLIDTLNEKSVYLLDGIDISCSLGADVFYTMLDNATYQLYKNDEPLFNKPNFIKLGYQTSNQEVYTNTTTQELIIKLEGLGYQTGSMVGVTQFKIFFSFNFIQVTNEKYIKKFWGDLR